MSIKNIPIRDLISVHINQQNQIKKKISKNIDIKNPTIGDFMYKKSFSTKVLLLYIMLSLICVAILFILYNL